MVAHRWRLGLVPVAMLSLLPAASAQVVRYATGFPDAAGWTMTAGSGSSWQVDATPASVAGAAAYHSVPYSLNFNDGVCFGAFACVGIAFGTATSPIVDISAPYGAATLSFWCAWDVETGVGCQYDVRRVQVSNDGFQSLLVNDCYFEPHCGLPGQWHAHTVVLSPSWGAIQVRFSFHTVDGMLNQGAGWFVDDLTVETECVPPASYCTAKLNSLGCTPFIYSTGFPSPTAPVAFRIRAAQVLNNKPGLLLYSYTSAATPFQGGFLCLGSPIARITVAGSGGNPPPPDCSGLYAYDFNDRIRSGVDPGLVPGEDVYAQYWSRDPLSAFGSGLTDGLTFVICP